MTLKEFWNSDEELAIHCDTEEKSNKLRKEFDKMGKRWSDGHTYLEMDYYLIYGGRTCYSNRGRYGTSTSYIENKIKIIEFDDIEDFKSTNDPVDHPSHYTDGKIEVIDFIEDKKLGFHLGNAIKYIARAGKKDPNKTIEDIKKAIWYLERYLEVLE